MRRPLVERLNGLLFEVGATGTSGDRTLLDGASHIAHMVGIPFVSVQQVVQDAERALWGAEETSQPPEHPVPRPQEQEQEAHLTTESADHTALGEAAAPLPIAAAPRTSTDQCLEEETQGPREQQLSGSDANPAGSATASAVLVAGYPLPSRGLSVEPTRDAAPDSPGTARLILRPEEETHGLRAHPRSQQQSRPARSQTRRRSHRRGQQLPPELTRRLSPKEAQQEPRSTPEERARDRALVAFSAEFEGDHQEIQKNRNEGLPLSRLLMGWEELCLDYPDRRKSFDQVVGESLETFLTNNHYVISGHGRRRKVRPGPGWRPILHRSASPQQESPDAAALLSWSPFDDDYDPIQAAFEHCGWSAPSGTTHVVFHPDHWAGRDMDLHSIRTDDGFGD